MFKERYQKLHNSIVPDETMISNVIRRVQTKAFRLAARPVRGGGNHMRHAAGSGFLNRLSGDVCRIPAGNAVFHPGAAR